MINTPREAAARVSAYLALQEEGRPSLIACPYDAGSAVLLESAGFKSLWTSSAGAAFALGRPDNSLTRAEALAHGAQIALAVRAPVFADFENGFGVAPQDVVETISAAALTELVGCSIEDYFPGESDPLGPISLCRERIAAACEAAKGAGREFLICARAENFLVGQPDTAATITRLQAYQEAGAGSLFAPGITRIGDLRAIVSAVDRPVEVLFTPRCEFDLYALYEIGVRRCILGSYFSAVAFSAIRDVACALLNEGKFPDTPLSVDFSTLNGLFTTTCSPK